MAKHLLHQADLACPTVEIHGKGRDWENAFLSVLSEYSERAREGLSQSHKGKQVRAGGFEPPITAPKAGAVPLGYALKDQIFCRDVA